MKLTGLLSMIVFAAGCTDQTLSGSSATTEYKIAEDGSPYTRDETEYESLEEKSLVKGQRYKIIVRQEKMKAPHFLVVNITKLSNGKKEDVYDGSMLYVSDGVASFDCNKMIFDLRISTKESEIPSITCKFEPIGVVALAQKAVVANDQRHAFGKCSNRGDVMRRLWSRQCGTAGWKQWRGKWWCPRCVDEEGLC